MAVMISSKQLKEESQEDFNKSAFDETKSPLKLSFNQSKKKTELLIHNGLLAITDERADKIFKPFPKEWTEMGIETCKKAIKILKLKTDYNYIIETLECSEYDSIFIERTNKYTYDFLLFILNSFPTFNLEDTVLIPKIGSGSFSDSTKKMMQYKNVYDKDKESNFKDKNTHYLYHGSPYSNWYSIMRTGIKNASNNPDLFLHGDVHGAGIYLSNDAMLSLGYSTSGANNWRVLAIYEVINNPAWKKTADIYVIPDESALILRYIIVFNYQIDSAILSNLNKLLNSDKIKIMEQKKVAEINKSAIGSGLRRITIEYNLLMKKLKANPADLGFTVELPEGDSNIKLWNIKIFNMDNLKLQEQMQKLQIPFIMLEIRFPDFYPIDPPFIRILSPRFKIFTGHVTSGGSICMQALSKQGWVPTTNIESLIIQIKMVLSDGDAVIDEINMGFPYTLEDAQTAFQRAVDSHKLDWIN